MALTPKLPPGRANRKALAYTADIQRLRASGYSFEAIRLTLLDAGLAVSRTTVKREAAKRPTVTQSARQRSTPDPFAKEDPALVALSVSGERAPAPPSLVNFAGDSRSGREIAEAFMKGRITNTLFLQEDHLP